MANSCPAITTSNKGWSALCPFPQISTTTTKMRYHHTHSLCNHIFMTLYLPKVWPYQPEPLWWLNGLQPAALALHQEMKIQFLRDAVEEKKNEIFNAHVVPKFPPRPTNCPTLFFARIKWKSQRRKEENNSFEVCLPSLFPALQVFLFSPVVMKFKKKWGLEENGKTWRREIGTWGVFLV